MTGFQIDAYVGTVGKPRTTNIPLGKGVSKERVAITSYIPRGSSQ